MLCIVVLPGLRAGLAWLEEVGGADLFWKESMPRQLDDVVLLDVLAPFWRRALRFWRTSGVRNRSSSWWTVSHVHAEERSHVPMSGPNKRVSKHGDFRMDFGPAHKLGTLLRVVVGSPTRAAAGAAPQGQAPYGGVGRRSEMLCEDSCFALRVFEARILSTSRNKRIHVDREGTVLARF